MSDGSPPKIQSFSLQGADLGHEDFLEKIRVDQDSAAKRALVNQYSQDSFSESEHFQKVNNYG